MRTFDIGFKAQMETSGKKQLDEGVTTVLGGEYECGVNAHHVLIKDIGGNVGAFALWAVHRFPYSFIDVFEPVPEVIKMLEKNTKFYESGIRINPFAVSTKKKLTLTVDPERLENTGKIVPANDGSTYDIRVKPIHPKDVISAHIFKIDCEGYEEEIITNLNLERTFLLIVEFHSDKQRMSVEAYLYKRGFHLHWTKPAPCYGLSGICFYINPKRIQEHKKLVSVFEMPGNFAL